MKKDKFKGHIEQVKNDGVEINSKFLRAKRFEEKGRAQKMRACAENGYGDFKDTLQHDNDLEDDIRCMGNFMGASRND